MNTTINLFTLPFEGAEPLYKAGQSSRDILTEGGLETLTGESSESSEPSRSLFDSLFQTQFGDVSQSKLALQSRIESPRPETSDPSELADSGDSRELELIAGSLLQQSGEQSTQGLLDQIKANRSSEEPLEKPLEEPLLKGDTPIPGLVPEEENGAWVPKFGPGPDVALALQSSLVPEPGKTMPPGGKDLPVNLAELDRNFTQTKSQLTINVPEASGFGDRPWRFNSGSGSTYSLNQQNVNGKSSSLDNLNNIAFQDQPIASNNQDRQSNQTGQGFRDPSSNSSLIQPGVKAFELSGELFNKISFQGQSAALFSETPHLPNQGNTPELNLATLISNQQANPEKIANTRLPATGGLESGNSFTITAQPGSADWHNQMTSRIRWMNNVNISSAELKLHPVELGTLEILISTEDDQTRVTFFTSSAASKEVIENSLPRLRDLLSNSGLLLEQGDVAHRDFSGNDADTSKPDSNDTIANEAGVIENSALVVTKTSNHQIDHYV